MIRQPFIVWCISILFAATTLAASRFERSPATDPINELLGSPYNDYLGPPIVARVLSIEDINGDLDSFPDTGETAQIRIALSNKTGTEYTNVAATIWSLDPTITRVTQVVAVGTLPANSEVVVAAPIEFKVSGHAERGGAAVTCVSGTCSNFFKRDGNYGAILACTNDAFCRRTPDQSYFGRLELSLLADQAMPLGSPLVIPIELDLNISNALAATSTFSHGFEGTVAPFVFQTLDTGKASNSLSIGYRCQKSDPDYPDSFSYGETECYLGFVSAPNPNDWHLHNSGSVDGGRARSGNDSLHFGVHNTALGAGFDTTSLSQLDTVRSGSLNVAARICRDDPSPNPQACNAASDCAGVGGGPCVSASPVLSFAHQVSLNDGRTRGVGPGMATDRGVVQAKAFPSGNWEDVPAFHNVPDAEGEMYFSNCTFDPVHAPSAAFTGRPRGSGSPAATV